MSHKIFQGCPGPAYHNISRELKRRRSFGAASSLAGQSPASPSSPAPGLEGWDMTPWPAYGDWESMGFWSNLPLWLKSWDFEHCEIMEIIVKSWKSLGNHVKSLGNHGGWWFSWNMDFIFPFSWEWSSQLTNILQRGRSTTNQHWFSYVLFCHGSLPRGYKSG